MKRIISVFILSSVFLGGLFSQDKSATSQESVEHIHGTTSNGRDHNYHTRFIFSEISNESEDSQERNISNIQDYEFNRFISNDNNIKNTLKAFPSIYISSHSKQNNSSPLFIRIRSILV